jgi:hypothetical protein
MRHFIAALALLEIGNGRASLYIGWKAKNS